MTSSAAGAAAPLVQPSTPRPGGSVVVNYIAERLQLIAWFVAIATMLGVAASSMWSSDLPMLTDVARWLLSGSAFCFVGMLASLIDTWGKRSFMWPRWTWRFADLGLAGLAVLLAAHGSYTSADPSVTTYLAGPVWIVAVAGALIATWPRREKSVARVRVQAWELFALTGLLLLALVLRLNNLHNVPEILSGEEGKLVQTARAFNQGDLFRPFVTAIDGNWGLWFMTLGAFTRLLGQTVDALRFQTILVGTLSILAAYALTRLLWGRRPALIVAALLATYHLHIHFSSAALNAIYDPLFFTLVFGLLWLGWLKQVRWPWLLGALALGLAQYFSTGGRIILVELVLLGLFWLATDRKRVKAQAFNIALAVGVFVVTTLPVAYFARLRIDDFLTQFNQANILRNGWLTAAMQADHTGALQVLWRQLTDTLKLIFTGPDALFYPGQALLTPVMGVLALAGLLYLLKHIKDSRAFFLISSLALIVVLGGVLMINPLAGAHHFVSALSLVYIAIAVVIDRAWGQLEQRWPTHRLTRWGGVLLVAALMLIDVYYYFGVFVPKHPPAKAQHLQLDDQVVSSILQNPTVRP